MANYWDDPGRGRTGGSPAYPMGAWANVLLPNGMMGQDPRTGMPNNVPSPVVPQPPTVAHRFHPFNPPAPKVDVNDLVNKLQMIAGAATGAADNAEATDPTSIYDKIRASIPDYSYNGPSADQMANQQFDPLFAMLAEQAKGQEARYKTGASKVGDAYNGFINDLMNSKKTNAQTYVDTGNQIGQNYDSASKSVTDNAAESARSLGEVLQRLGIQEGADTLLAGNQAQTTKELGRLASNRQSAQDLNTGLAASTSRFDTNNIDIGRQAGALRQSDMLDAFLQQQNENDQKRLELQSQKGQAQNQYGMQIQDLLSKGYATHENAISDTYKNQLDQLYRDQQLQLDQSRLSLDATKAGIGPNGEDLKGGNSTNNAYRTLQSAAKSYYGNDQQAAQAAQTILEALKSAPGAQDIGTLLSQIPEETLRQPYMADLAYQFFNSILNNKGR